MKLDEKYIDELIMSVKASSDDPDTMTLWLPKEIIEKYKDSLQRTYPDVEFKEIPKVYCGS